MPVSAGRANSPHQPGQSPQGQQAAQGRPAAQKRARPRIESAVDPTPVAVSLQVSHNLVPVGAVTMADSGFRIKHHGAGVEAAKGCVLGHSQPFIEASGLQEVLPPDQEIGTRHEGPQPACLTGKKFRELEPVQNRSCICLGIGIRNAPGSAPDGSGSRLRIPGSRSRPRRHNPRPRL